MSWAVAVEPHRVHDLDDLDDERGGRAVRRDACGATAAVVPRSSSVRLLLVADHAMGWCAYFVPLPPTSSALCLRFCSPASKLHPPSAGAAREV